MRSQRIISLVLPVVASGLATPFPSSGGLSGLMTRETPHEYCEKNDLDDTDTSVAKGVWDNTGTGAWFDQWLDDHKKDLNLWTRTMDREVTHNNGQSSFSCATLDSSCGPPDDCEFHFTQNMAQAYWVLYSATRLHEGLSYIDRALTDSTIVNSLNIPDMVDKYGGEDPSGDLNVLSAVASGLTIAAGAAAPVAAAAGPLTVLAGVFSMMSLFPGGDNVPDPTSSLSKQFGDTFETAKVSLKDLTSTIFGGGSDLDIKKIPGQTGDFRNPLARLFADGKFLLEDIESKMQNIFEDYVHIQQLMISGMLIEAYGYVVVVDTKVKEAGYCKGMNSNWWSEGKKRCYQIMKNRKDDGKNMMPLGLDDGPMTVAMNDYKIDVGEFFAIAYDCAEKHPDGDGKVTGDSYKMPKDGSKPECFYSVPVVEGAVTWNEYGYAYITDIGLNTGGVRDLPPETPNSDDRGDLKETGSWCHYGVGGGVGEAEHCCGLDGVGGEWNSGQGRCYGLALDKDKCSNFYGCCIDTGAKNRGDDPCH